MKPNTFDPGPIDQSTSDQQQPAVDKTKPHFHSIKQSLDNILKHPQSKQIILQTVLTSHKIVIHAYQFLKLYLLYHYEHAEPLPIINKDLVLTIMKVICDESIPEEDNDSEENIKEDDQSSGKGKEKIDDEILEPNTEDEDNYDDSDIENVNDESTDKEPEKRDNRRTQASIDLQQKILLFHREFYKLTMNSEELSRFNLHNVLSYLALDIVTTYETNIKQHYVEYLERFINVLFHKKQISKNLSKLDQNKFYAKLRSFKNAVLSQYDIIDPLLDHHIKHIIPQRVFSQKNVIYDLKVKPQDYLSCMIYMMKFVEAQNETIYNLFPLRTELIPKYIRLDTTSLVHVLMTKDNKHVYGNKSDYGYGNIKKRQDEIWSCFFRTELRCFFKPKDNKLNNYQFAHMIETDGIACSILWVRKDLAPEKKKPKFKAVPEQYIDDGKVDLKALQGKKIVGIDPNKGDLIFCVADSGDGHAQTFRYTQDQRRKETKQKKYRDLRDMFKETNDIAGKPVKEWETELSAHNKKTLDITKFYLYILKKNEINSKLMPFYQQYIFRKLKWNSFVNTQRSEDNMLNKFKEKFGKPKDVVIGFGDWEQKHQMKYKEPTKGKGFRKLFRKAGYQVYLVNEYRTSCRCYDCEGECVKFKKCKNPRPWKANEIILRHGLVMCKTCKRTWNRDVNSALNMHWITKKTIEGDGRPEYLRREGEKKKKGKSKKK